MKRALPVLAVVLAAAAPPASAQPTYRWLDPVSGHTVYSDQPPPAGARKPARLVDGKADGERRNAQLPYAVRAAAEKFPVTLYTSADCTDSCREARSLLNGRGVPFQEKLVQPGTPDIDELKQLTGGKAFVPVVVVGRQSSKGFDADSWNTLLDLAGYPKAAALGSKPSGAFAP